MNDLMHMSDLGGSLTKGYEKLVLTSYKPTINDRWTIGYGSTFHIDGTPVQEGETITEEQANSMFANDMVKFENGVKSRICIPLEQNQFDSCVDLAYNAGFGYRDHTGTYHDWDLWHNINNGMAGDDLFNYWTTLAITQAGIKLNGLIRRRKSEVTYYQTGIINFFEN